MVAAISLMWIAVASARGPVVKVTVQEDTGERIVLRYEIGEVTQTPVVIDGATYQQVMLPGESMLKREGAPELPHVARSVIIPKDAEMRVNVLHEEHIEITDIDVAPSKGILLRTVNPEDVPFTFGAEYGTDALYPATTVSLSDPYILRDHRGVVVKLNPVQYNPVTRTLRVLKIVELEVVSVGAGQINVPVGQGPMQPVRDFKLIYKHHFLNYVPAVAYDPLDEMGTMLVIAHDAWLANVQPFVDHKNARGLTTVAIGVSTIPGGNNAASIKSYIQSIYNTGDLAFVLLVGDHNQVATPYASGGAADPTYALLAGGDHYPDIFVGRFSAETPAHVDTQVLRTLQYEQMPATSTDWFKKAVGIGSAEGAGIGDDGESDKQHMENIRIDLLDYGYTAVDQVYDPGAADWMVSQALNDGRGLINYCGHGDTTSWVTTGFNNADVDALTNVDMLPFIISVACVNGDFDGPTCFAEAWVRATHAGEPAGAIGIYASSINQSWAPPMAAQDEIVDLLVAEGYMSFGALSFAGSCLMMDEYGGAGVEMYDTWHVFADPSLQVVVSCTDTGNVSLSQPMYGLRSTVPIKVNDCGLNVNDLAYDTVTVAIVSDTEPAGEFVILTESGPDSGEFAGSIELSDFDEPGILHVSHDDTVTVTYIDEDDGLGGTNVVVTAEAQIDGMPPVITELQVTDVTPVGATIKLQADEVSICSIDYGLSCDSLDHTIDHDAIETVHVIPIVGLDENTEYFFAIDIADPYDNAFTDDNAGSCYSFVTTDAQDIFSQKFSDVNLNDLAGLSLTLTPNLSIDMYAACSEGITALPVDPAAGTLLVLEDDDFAEVVLEFGETVTLYGVAYDRFFVGSNGYVTFGQGDTASNPTANNHFALPRIAGLFENLMPDQAGEVRWMQMADRAVVTWFDVPDELSLAGNTFQFEMFFNGDLRMSWLNLSCSGGLIGLSAGEGKPPFVKSSDLSSYASCNPAPGDLDLDGDVDLDDHALFYGCLLGPNLVPGDDVCLIADFDADSDVDLFDWRSFASVFTDAQ